MATKRPAMPAAASRCPILALTAPSVQNPVFVVLKARVTASISMGSPIAVAVPCADKKPIFSGSIWLIAKASVTTSTSPRSDGAV